MREHESKKSDGGGILKEEEPEGEEAGRAVHCHVDHAQGDGAKNERREGQVRDLQSGFSECE